MSALWGWNWAWRGPITVEDNVRADSFFAHVDSAPHHMSDPCSLGQNQKCFKKGSNLDVQFFKRERK